MHSIAIVTDSTASLPADLAASRDIVVVPLQVVIGGAGYVEGEGFGPDELADALREFVPVSTSRPSPERFAQAYERAVASGAREIVSVHLSAQMSGTYDAAVVAAKSASVPVHCVDSRQVGMGTGFATLTAADLRDGGATVEEVAAGAGSRGESASTLFYVDTLEYLRRGGRVGAAAALLGSALAVKPILTLRDGKVRPLEKVRTTSRAIARLQELASEAYAGCLDGADIAVQHLGSQARADAVAADLAQSLGVDDILVGEVGAVIGAHVGPGTLSVTVSGRPKI